MDEYIEKSKISYKIEEEKVAFIKWVKVHKNELFLAGISIASLICVIIGIKNKDSIKELWAAVQKTVSKIPSDKAIMKVTRNSIPVVETVRCWWPQSSLCCCSLLSPPISPKKCGKASGTKHR